MSNVKLLLDIVSEMSSLAESIKTYAEAIETGDEIQPIQAKEKPKKEIKKVTLEQVRAVLAEKSRNGHTAVIRTLLEKYGANKLSEISPEKYADLLADAEVLGNG